MSFERASRCFANMHTCNFWVYVVLLPCHNSDSLTPSFAQHITPKPSSYHTFWFFLMLQSTSSLQLLYIVCQIKTTKGGSSCATKHAGRDNYVHMIVQYTSRVSKKKKVVAIFKNFIPRLPFCLCSLHACTFILWLCVQMYAKRVDLMHTHRHTLTHFIFCLVVLCYLCIGKKKPDDCWRLECLKRCVHFASWEAAVVQKPNKSLWKL